jgi:general secretion pathway protein I
MIALAIAGISLIALLSLSNRSIGVNGRLQKITQATLLAQEKMGEAEAAADRGRLRYENDEGKFLPPFDEFRWQIAFEDTPLPTVKMVTVMVLWGEEKKNELVELNSFLF